MNLNFINQEFERLATIEGAIDYEFEPKSKLKYGKRNIYYEDLKNDFINEVNTFGFSPFILENFEKQRKNPNIMKYMNKKFNQGLINYVKMQTKSVNINPLSGNVIKKKSKNLNKKLPIIENTFYLKRKEIVKEKDKKDNFLQKAFENLGGNKLNISSDDDDENINSIHNNDNKNNIQKNQKAINKNYDEIKKKLSSQLREKFMKQKDFAHPSSNNNNSIPQISISEFNKPEALKINFERFFAENINNNEYKKIVALSKNKEFLINQKDNKINTNSIKNDSKQKTPISKLSKEKKNKIKKYKNIIIQPSKSKSETFELFERCRPLKITKRKGSIIKIKIDENETK